ncbi:MAG TPA: hypothetical protein VEY08_05980 [Chloroflexia bacterium]|nr:hypothetical protein [Chloroflexia bacterium]
MGGQAAAQRIRWGILCLPLAGLAGLQALVVSGDYVYPMADLQGYAEYVTSTRYHYAVLLYALQATLALIGVVALYAYFVNRRGERWALAGLVSQVAGLMLLAGTGGATTSADVSAIPAAERYLEGQDAMKSVLLGDLGNIPPLITVCSALGFLIYLLSGLLWGIAVWRSGTLPQGAAILLVGATVLTFVTINPSVALFGWIQALVVALDLGGSGWIAWSVWQQPLDRKPGLT